MTLQKGFTPLHIASNLGSKGIIEALILHGSCLNKQSKVRIVPAGRTTGVEKIWQLSVSVTERQHPLAPGMSGERNGYSRAFDNERRRLQLSEQCEWVSVLVYAVHPWLWHVYVNGGRFWRTRASRTVLAPSLSPLAPYRHSFRWKFR